MTKQKIAKLASFILAGAVGMVLLAGCGGATGTAQTDNETGTAQAESAEAAASEVTVTTSSGDGSGTATEDKSRLITDTEQVLVDNDICTVWLEKIFYDSAGDFTATLQTENKTDNEIRLETEYCYYNGLRGTDFYWQTVPAGKKGSSDFFLLEDELYGMDCTEFAFRLEVYYSDSFDPLFTEDIRICPYGEDGVVEYEREPQPGDITLVDNGSLLLMVTDAGFSSGGSYTVQYYVENRTDSTLDILSENESVNDIMVSSSFYIYDLMPGCSAYDEGTWYADKLESSGITDVQEIEYDLTVRISDDYSDSGKVYSGLVTFSPDGTSSVTSYSGSDAEGADSAYAGAAGAGDGSTENETAVPADDEEPVAEIFGRPQGSGATLDGFRECMDRYGQEIISETTGIGYDMALTVSDTLSFNYQGYDEGSLTGTSLSDLEDILDIVGSAVSDITVTHSGTEDDGCIWLEGYYDYYGDRYFVYSAVVGDTFIFCNGAADAEGDALTILRDLGY